MKERMIFKKMSSSTKKQSQISTSKLYSKKFYVCMTLLFATLYFISYTTRINYGAVISEIVSAEGMQKSLASLALTASAITYGVGQLVSGFFGDRINPKRLILIGLFTTIAMNLIIPFCNSPYQMTAVWAVNGLAQAFMWPPMVKIMTSLFTQEDYIKSCMYVSFGSSFGTIFVYAIAPVCIMFAGWKSIFILSSVMAIIMALVWQKNCPDVEVNKDKTLNKSNTKNKNKSSSVFTPTVIGIIGVIMLVIVLQGILRDGVATWMPSYITETFKLDNKVSILTGVVLPIFSIVTLKITNVIYRKLIRSELLLVGIMFLAGFTSSFLLYYLDDSSAVVSVILAAILSGSMHGANSVLTCMIPPYFGKYGNISFMSGLLNFCTYIGSAASGIGIAAFSESYGWNKTLLLWSVIALIAVVLCGLFAKKWNKIKN